MPREDGGRMFGHGALPRSCPRPRGALQDRMAVEQGTENHDTVCCRGNEEAQPPGDDFAHQAERLHRVDGARRERSEEHTSELRSLMRISYAVFCLKKKKEP